jgi:hypothetical protein
MHWMRKHGVRGMRKPDGQLDLLFCPECLWAGDTWTLSMHPLIDKKALIKAIAKILTASIVQTPQANNAQSF